MNENERKTGRFSRFLEEKGFYIILFLCALAIGIAGYVLFVSPEAAEPAVSETESASAQARQPDRNSGTVISGRSGGYSAPGPNIPEEKTDVSGPDPDVVETMQPSGSLTQDKAETEKPEDRPQAQPNAEADEPKAGTPAPAAQTPAAPEEKPAPSQTSPADKAPDFFVKPVAGDVIRSVSVTELVYDRTMGDWRTHNGADFAAVTGETVMAVADGTVESVTQSEFYGTVVVISHGGGLESRYFGLAEQATVREGDAVRAGDVIGSVSPSAHFEALEPVHLHLEMLKDGKYIDPAEYLAG